MIYDLLQLTDDASYILLHLGGKSGNVCVRRATGPLLGSTIKRYRPGCYAAIPLSPVDQGAYADYARTLLDPSRPDGGLL